jgi:hypothetical protein
MKLLRGCLSVLVTGIVLMAIAYGGWRWGGEVFPAVERMLGRSPTVVPGEPQPSEEIAEAALDRYQDLLRSPAGTEAMFSGLEVTSLIRFSFPGMLPPGLAEPTVIIRDGTLDLQARVARDRFPSFPRLDGVLEILPDTVPLEVGAVVLPFDPAHVSVMVQRIDASAIPVPRRFIPDILEAVGRRSRPGLPPTGVAVPLPDGLSGVYVQADSLVLVSGG